MISFDDVSGPCIIEDGIQSRQAQTGMTISNYGDKCVVATGEGGRARLRIHGSSPVNLPPNSYLVVRPQGARPYRHKTNSSDLKIWVGRIWATAFEVFGGRPSEDIVDGSNAVAGVRG